MFMVHMGMAGRGNLVAASGIDENLSAVVQAFLQAKNSCYMDGTDMMGIDPDAAYGIFRNRMVSLLAEENYSTIFYCFRQAYANEIYRLRGEVITDYQYSGWIRRIRTVNGKYEVYVEEVLNYRDASRNVETGVHQYFTLTIQPDRWMIEKIKSGDVLYNGYYNEGDGIGLADKFNKLFADLAADYWNKKEVIPTVQSPVYLPANTVVYDGMKAAEYAQTYWYTYNSAFPSYSGVGGDCANYASQSVYAGLQQTMLDFGLYNSDSWYHYNNRNETGENWTWTSTSRFHRYLMKGNGRQYGLYGMEIDIRDVRPGDIVHVDYTSDGEMDHSIVITHVDNMNGSNSYSEILFSGHTADRKNQPLSDMGYRPTYRALRVFGLVAPQMKSGQWLNENGNWSYYHAQAEDKIRNEWSMIDGKWYYFDHNGYCQFGWEDIDGKRYYFNPDGAMETGWIHLDGKRFFLQPDGSMATGFLDYEGDKYYFNLNGVMQTGWVTAGPVDLLFSSDGKLVR